MVFRTSCDLEKGFISIDLAFLTSVRSVKQSKIREQSVSSILELLLVSKSGKFPKALRALELTL